MVFCGVCEMKVQEGGNITAITVEPEWNHFRMVNLDINLPIWIITVNEISILQFLTVAL